MTSRNTVPTEGFRHREKENLKEWNTQDEIDYVNSLSSLDLVNSYLRSVEKRVNWYNMNRHVILKHARKRARVLEHRALR